MPSLRSKLYSLKSYLLMIITSLSGASLVPSYAGELDWQHWPVVGKAELRWFVFDVYTSELRSDTGYFQTAQQPVDQNLALRITYQRSIDADDLLIATQEQWQHLGYGHASISQWSRVLAGIFPSVQDGDELVFRVHDRQGDFYYRKKGEVNWLLSGEIKDPLFVNAFISIWLSPETEYPGLRQKLIGGSQHEIR